VTEEVPVKFLKHGKQGLPERDKSFIDFRPGKDIHPQGGPLIHNLAHISRSATPTETVADDVAYNLILAEQLPLIGTKHIRS
jgi:hypothetical protein